MTNSPLTEILLTNDLLRHNQNMMRELKVSALTIMEGGWYVLGRQVEEFEDKFAAYCQTSHCVTVANGTDALELGLRAIGVIEGDKVITVANAGAYSTVAILAMGAIPEYVDIDPKSMLISIEHLSTLIDSETRAIIVTHLYGHVASMGAILEQASKFGIPVLEDCAQAHGGLHNGRRVGSYGAIGCFSFYPTKNLGALGDGGALVTNDAAIATRVRMLRQYGWEQKYQIGLAGGRNSRLDELQAALLSVKLPYLDAWNQRRVQISDGYLDGIRHPMITLPSIFPGSYVGHLFVVRTRERKSLREHLKNLGIMSDIHYPIPDYQQPAILKLFPDISLPATERACEEVLSLPCFPEMSDAEIQRVVDAVNSWPTK